MNFKPIIGFFLGVALFSLFLQFRTLSFDSTKQEILVSGKYWSDFGGHLPQIRSFSLGSNWPPQYPLFSGEKIKYHFLFFFMVGLLEKAGVRLDYALNVPSTLGFLSLAAMIFALASRLFKTTKAGFLAVIFFIFNPSLSWLEYLKQTNFDLVAALQKLPSLSTYPAFGPWNGSSIAAFWNLNVYTNQRHLAISIALCLVIVYILRFKSGKWIYLLGAFSGLLLLLNQAVFLVTGVILLSFFIFVPQLRLKMFVSGFGALPFLLFGFLYVSTSPNILIKPLYLYSGNPGDLIAIVKYYFSNFGLTLILAPMGVLLTKKYRLPFLLSLLVPSILASIFQFSPDMINNHKFFNVYLVLSAIFCSGVISYLLNTRLKILAFVLSFFLILGGVVDLFPVLNDNYYRVPDIYSNPDARFFAKNTSPSSVVLNSTWFYHPASIAGRKIYNGYSYFTWSFGYDQVAREQATVAVYQSATIVELCSHLFADHIDFVELNDRPESFIHPNLNLWLSKPYAYRNSQSGVTVYSRASLCP